MSAKHIVSYVFSFTLLLSLCVVCRSDVIVFEKTVGQQRKVVAYRHDFLWPSASESEKAADDKWLEEHPGGRLTTAKYGYEYSFYILSSKTVKPGNAKQEVVFMKHTGSRQSISVSKQEFTWPSQADAQKEEDLRYEKNHPGFYVGPNAKYGYEYSFVQESDKNDTQKFLWSFKTGSFQPYNPENPVVRIFDVDIQNGNLVVAYQDFGSIQCNIIRISSQDPTKSKPMTYQESVLIPDDLFRKRFLFGVGGPYSAEITGSLTKGDLTVIVDKGYPSARAFHWRNSKWIYQDLSNEPILTKPVVIGGKKWILELTKREAVVHSVKNLGWSTPSDMTGTEMRLRRRPAAPSSTRTAPNRTAPTRTVPTRIAPEKVVASTTISTPAKTSEGELLWGVFFGNGRTNSLNERWLADTYVDEAQHKIYFALNYGPNIWVQVLDSETTVKELYVNFRAQPLVSAAPQFLDEYDLPPWVLRFDDSTFDTVMQRMPSVREVKIEKVKGQLFLTLRGSQSPLAIAPTLSELKWLYDDKSKVWQPVPALAAPAKIN